ncbi:hypothetical protein [Pseudozobellia thermophila]|nr:hypothetical protein [Pseudozobellia thermophila]
MKNLIVQISFLFLFNHFGLFAQDTISNEKIYIDNDLAFKYSDGQPFSGIAQIRKKNGQIAFEMEYEDGVILKQYVYYRRKKNNRKLATKVLYDPQKPWKEVTEIRYFSSFEEWTFYDENGNRTLKEQRKNGEIIYSCEYSGRKKHGQEMCLDDDGAKMFIEYVNGKRKK